MLVFKGQFTYSLANIHGDVFATINGVGSLIATHLSGPFGEQVSGQVAPNNTLTGATYNWVGTKTYRVSVNPVFQHASWLYCSDEVTRAINHMIGLVIESKGAMPNPEQGQAAVGAIVMAMRKDLLGKTELDIREFRYIDVIEKPRR